MPLGGGVVSSNSADSRRASLLSSRGGSGSLAGGPMGLSGGGFDSPTLSHLSGASALDFSGIQDLPPPHESAYGYTSESETASDVGGPVLSALRRPSLIVTPAPAVGHGPAHGHGYGQSTSTSTSTSSGQGGELIQRRISTDLRVGPESHEIQGNGGGGLGAVKGHMRPGPVYGRAATESQQTRPPMQKQSELLYHSTSSVKSDRNRLKPTNTCDTDVSSVVFETDPVPGSNPGHADQWQGLGQGVGPSQNPPPPMQPQLSPQQYQWPTSLNQCLVPGELLEKYQLPRRYVNSLFDRWTKNFGSDPCFDDRGGNWYGAGGFYNRFPVTSQTVQSNPYLNPNPFCMLQPFTSSMSCAPSPLSQALGQFPHPSMGINGAQSHYFPMEARERNGSAMSGRSDGAVGGRSYSEAGDDELNALPYIIGRQNSNTTESTADDCSVRVFDETAGFEEVAASNALDTCASSEVSGVSPSIWPPTSSEQIAQQFEQRQHEISEKLRKFRRVARMITAMDLESRKRLRQKRRIGLDRSSSMAASADDDEPTAIVTDLPGHSTGELLEQLTREKLLNSDSSASDHSDPHSLEYQSADIRVSEEEQEASSIQANRPLKCLHKKKSLAADPTASLTSSGMPLYRMVSIIRASRKWKRLIKQHSLPPFLETVVEENSSETSVADEPLFEATHPPPLPSGVRKLEATADSNSQEKQIAPLWSKTKAQQQRQQSFKASRRSLRASSSPEQQNTNLNPNPNQSSLQSCLKFDDMRTTGSSPEPLSSARQQTLKQRCSSSSEYEYTPLSQVARNLQLLRSAYKSCEQKAPLPVGRLNRMRTISGVEPRAAVLSVKQQQPLAACSFQSSQFQSELSAGALQSSFQSAQQMSAVSTRAIAGSTASAQHSRQQPQPPSRYFQKRPMHLSLPRCFSVDEERGKRSPTQQRQQPVHSTTFSFEPVGAQSSSAIAVACDTATNTDDDMEDDSPLEQWCTSEESDGDVDGYTALVKAAEKKRGAKLEVRQFTVHTEQPRFDKCCPRSPSALYKCLKSTPTAAPSGSKCGTRNSSVADECLSRRPSVSSSVTAGATDEVGKCSLSALDSKSMGAGGHGGSVRIRLPMPSGMSYSSASAPQAYNNLALAGLGSTRDTNASLEGGESEYSFAIAGGGGGCSLKWVSRASSCASSCAAGQLRAAASLAAPAVEPLIPIDIANSSNGEQQNHSDKKRHQSESSSIGQSLTCEADSTEAGEQQDGEEAESTTHSQHPPACQHLEAEFEVENAARRASFMVSRASFSMQTLGRRRMSRQHAVQHDDEHQHQQLLHGQRLPTGVRSLRPDEPLSALEALYERSARSPSQSNTSMQPRRYSLASVHPTSVSQAQGGDGCCGDCDGSGGGGGEGGGRRGGRMGRGRGEAPRRSSTISEFEKQFSGRRSSDGRHVSFSAQLQEFGDTTTTASGTESDTESSVNSLLSPRIQLRGTRAGLSACVPADKCDAHTSEEASGGVEEGNQNNAYCNTELAAESEAEYGSVKSEEITLPMNAERQEDSRNEEDNSDGASKTCISPPMEKSSFPPTPPSSEPVLQKPSFRRVSFPSISTASTTISSSNSQRTSSRSASIQATASVESVAVQTESNTCPQTTFTLPPRTRDSSTRCATVQTTESACLEDRVRRLGAATKSACSAEHARSLHALALLVAPCEPEFLALPELHKKPNARESSRGPSGAPMIGSNRASQATPGPLSAPMLNARIKLKLPAEPIDRTTAHRAPPLPLTANLFITANSGVKESEPVTIGNLCGGRLEIQKSLISKQSQSHVGLVYEYHSRERPASVQTKTPGSLLPHSPYSLPLCSHIRHTQKDNSNSAGTLHSTQRALTPRQSQRESCNAQQVEANFPAQVQVQLPLRRRLPTFWQVLQEEGLVEVATRPEFCPLPDIIPFQRPIAFI